MDMDRSEEEGDVWYLYFKKEIIKVGRWDRNNFERWKDVGRN